MQAIASRDEHRGEEAHAGRGLGLRRPDPIFAVATTGPTSARCGGTSRPPAPPGTGTEALCRRARVAPEQVALRRRTLGSEAAARSKRGTTAAVLLVLLVGGYGDRWSWTGSAGNNQLRDWPR